MSIDLHSTTWTFVKEWAEKELKLARDECECPGLGLPETEYARGRLSLAKELLELASKSGV